MNVWIILTLIVVVAGFNMVSGLLILILDKTSFIGILKALGYRNIRLRRLFLYIAAGLIGKGMVVGNILALTLGGLQALFRIVRLDSATYGYGADLFRLGLYYFIECRSVGSFGVDVGRADDVDFQDKTD